MRPEDIQRARQFLFGRKGAYSRVFQGTGFDGATVLADLMKFGRMFESTFHPDPRVHALMEGRREMALRIQQHLNLSDEDLWRLLNGAQPTKGE